MAVRSGETARLILKIEYGTGTRNRSISDINPELSDNNALSIMTKYGAMQTHTVAAVVREDIATLTAS